MKKKLLFVTVLSVAMLMAGCSAKTEATESKDNSEVVIEINGDLGDEETEDEASNNEYSYGDEITIKLNETIVVEGQYEFTLDEIYEVTGAASFTVNRDGQNRNVTIYPKDDGSSFEYNEIPMVVPPYVIETKEIGDSSVTMTLSKREFPEPMVLSGNPDDMYEIEDYSYVVGERADLFFDKGITVPGDTLDLVETVITELEEETGLKFFNDTVYSNLPGSVSRDNLYGSDPWNGYNKYGSEKIVIYFVVNKDPDQRYISYSHNNCVVLYDEDFDFHGYSLNTISHELAHSLSAANFDSFERILTEGFGSYWGRRISILHPEFIDPDLEWKLNAEYYWSLYPPMTAETAEEMYVQDFDRMENSSYYEYGFQLMTYLYETYTTEEINAFFTDLSAELMAQRKQEYPNVDDLLRVGIVDDISTLEFERDFIMEYFGEDFFTKLGTWAEENADRFSWPAEEVA